MLLLPANAGCTGNQALETLGRTTANAARAWCVQTRECSVECAAGERADPLDGQCRPAPR